MAGSSRGSGPPNPSEEHTNTAQVRLVHQERRGHESSGAGGPTGRCSSRDVTLSDTYRMFPSVIIAMKNPSRAWRHKTGPLVNQLATAAALITHLQHQLGELLVAQERRLPVLPDLAGLRLSGDLWWAEPQKRRERFKVETGGPGVIKAYKGRHTGRQAAKTKLLNST